MNKPTPYSFPSENGQSPKKTDVRIFLFLLTILTILPYLQLSSHEFINWDDPIYIYDNPIVSSGLSWLGVGWAFITFTASNWHPLTWISHMLDASLFGPTPAAAHWVNLFWFTGSVPMIFFLFLRFGASREAAFLMAAFYGAHPLHVESVAWAAERKDVLCAFFFFAATVAHIGYTRVPSRSRYLFTTVLFILALLSKPTAVVWPFVALLVDFWPLQRFKKELKKVIREKIPWVFFSVITAVLTIIAQRKSEAIKSVSDFPLWDRLINAVLSYFEYIRQSLWPSGLTVFYPYPYSYSFEIPKILTACSILLLITAVAVRQARRRPYLLWGWLFYLGVLVPVIGLVQIGGQAHADRYTLIPQAGLIVASGLFLDEYFTREKIRRVLGIAMILIAAVLMLMTFRQVSYWKDTKTLFYQNLDAAGGNGLAHFNLGEAYLSGKQYELAVAHFLAAARMDPTEAATYNNLGEAYANLHQNALAEQCFQKAILLDPTIAQPHFLLAVLKMKEGNLDEAARQLDVAGRLAPQWKEVNDLQGQLKKLRSESHRTGNHDLP